MRSRPGVSPPPVSEPGRGASSARRGRGAPLARLLVLGGLLLAPPAAALPGLELGGGLEPAGGFGGRALFGGPTAAYFNPALLPGAPRAVDLALVGSLRPLTITLDERPAAFDVDESILRARIVDGATTRRPTQRPLPTASLRQPRGAADPSAADLLFQLGATWPVLPDTLTVGLLFLAPLGTLQAQQPFFVDEREQYFSNSLHFELYGDRLGGLGMACGLGWAPWPQLALGLGVTLLNDSTARAEVYVPDASDQRTAETNPEVAVGTRLAPHGGLVVRPFGDDTLQLTATLHPVAENPVTGTSALQFWDYTYPEGEDALIQEYQLTYGYEPLRLGFGLAGRLGLGRVTLQPYAEGVWARWSTYRNRHAEEVADWADTLSLGLGVRLGQGPQTVSLAGLYAPSPVPEQTGRTSYVDNDRLGLQVGYRREVQVGSWPLALGVGLQVQRLLARRHVKQPDAAEPVIDEFPDAVDVRSGEPLPRSAGLQTNSPGFPGYSSEGWLLGARVSLQVAQ